MDLGFGDLSPSPEDLCGLLGFPLLPDLKSTHAAFPVLGGVGNQVGLIGCSPMTPGVSLAQAAAQAQSLQDNRKSQGLSLNPEKPSAALGGATAPLLSSAETCGSLLTAGQASFCGTWSLVCADVSCEQHLFSRNDQCTGGRHGP